MMPIFDVPDIDDIPLTFGKHKGYTPNWIGEHDPDYIVWLYENTEGNCSKELYHACSEDWQERQEIRRMNNLLEREDIDHWGDNE